MQNPQPQPSGDVIIETRNVSRLYPGVMVRSGQLSGLPQQSECPDW